MGEGGAGTWGGGAGVEMTDRGVVDKLEVLEVG